MTKNQIRALTIIASMRQVLNVLEKRVHRNEIGENIVRYIDITSKSLETGFDLVGYALNNQQGRTVELPQETWDKARQKRTKELIGLD